MPSVNPPTPYGQILRGAAFVDAVNGDNTFDIPVNAGQSIVVFAFILSAGAAANARFKDSNGDSLSCLFTLAVNNIISHGAAGKDSMPLMVCGQGKGLVINLSTAGPVGAMVLYGYR